MSRFPDSPRKRSPRSIREQSRGSRDDDSIRLMQQQQQQNNDDVIKNNNTGVSEFALSEPPSLDGVEISSFENPRKKSLEDDIPPPHHIQLNKDGTPKYSPPKGWERTRMLGNLAVNLAVAAQWISLLFLPAIYSALTEALGFDSSQLGALHTMRLFSMFFSLPFFAWLCYKVSRRVLLSGTLFLSGIFTIINAATYDYASFMVVNIISGILLGAVHPVARSIVPNYYDLYERGQYFGYLELSSGIGGFIGAGVAVAISRYGKPTGAYAEAFNAQMTAMNLTYQSSQQELANVTVDGTGICCNQWQLVYITMGLFLMPLSLGTYVFLTDPVMDVKKVSRLGTGELVRVFPGLQTGFIMPTKKEITDLFRKGTFTCMVLQGCFGAFPWSGLSFLIFWFQRMGVEEILAVVIFACVGLGAAIGGLIGGVIGDSAAASKFLGPKYGRKLGRIWISQLSVIIGIPYSACLMQVIPYQSQYWWIYAVVGGLMGLSIAWPPANNAANQSDIFPQHVHPTSFAVQFWLEGTVSAFSPFVVGVLNDYAFNAKNLSPPGGQAEWDSYSPEYQQQLLSGLADSLTFVCVVFWFLCALCYAPMYYYYPLESRALNPGKFEGVDGEIENILDDDNENDVKKGEQTNTTTTTTTTAATSNTTKEIKNNNSDEAILSDEKKEELVDSQIVQI